MQRIQDDIFKIRQEKSTFKDQYKDKFSKYIEDLKEMKSSGVIPGDIVSDSSDESLNSQCEINSTLSDEVFDQVVPQRMDQKL